MKAVIVKLKTIHALGVFNVARVLLHRGKTKIGIKHTSFGLMPKGPFFRQSALPELPFSPTNDWQARASYFGWWLRPLGVEAPDWHLNPINNARTSSEPWWKLPDFSSDVGDIKLVWEASRMTWLFAFIERYLAGNREELSKLNAWLEDWCVNNPQNIGANWKCGQEAGIRVMHLAMSAMLLRQAHAPTQALISLIEIHLKRIAPTLRYAISQDNNHGTSEAAALYIGGNWLVSAGHANGKKWARLGQKWLENLASRLIMADGSFSQYSVNYHRVLLDTLSMVELWRRHLSLQPFSERFQKRAALAVEWLAAMVDPKTGDAPNLGANDSAYLFPVASQELRDFRASVQTAMILFKGVKAYPENGIWNTRLLALGLPLPKLCCELPQSQVFDEGGYAVLRQGAAMALLRYPRFQFRPSQADILHVDLWYDGENYLRDAGSYSYASVVGQDYFSGTKSHNTIQFDDRDQMPRLSRFLFGDWLKTDTIEPLCVEKNSVSFAASYRDRYKVYHRRKLILSDKKLTVIDSFHGFRHKAVLRWRLKVADWFWSEHQLISSIGKISIASTVPIVRKELVKGMESRYYLQKNETPVFEVELHQAGEITTEYTWCL